jgi:hypothetical protein
MLSSGKAVTPLFRKSAPSRPSPAKNRENYVSQKIAFLLSLKHWGAKRLSDLPARRQLLK